MWEGDDRNPKVVFCLPTLKRPHPATLSSLELSIPLIEAAGWEHAIVHELGCVYISVARATMLRKALDAKADVIIFLDDDVSWDPPDLLTLIQTPGNVVCGNYRFKRDDIEEYMGSLIDGPDNRPITREDGCIKAWLAPAGFLKVTKQAVDIFVRKYPELCYGSAYSPSIDLFNHGAMDGKWYSEDYAFAKRWRETGNDFWMVPNLNITHHRKGTKKSYPGNYHEFLLRRPGGSKEGEGSGITNRLRKKSQKKVISHRAGLERAGNSRHQPRTQA
jgi:glycosyltransferase involved in cell wall biosynthesis